MLCLKMLYLKMLYLKMASCIPCLNLNVMRRAQL